MRPDELVRVQIRSVGGQPVQFQASGQTCHIALRQFGGMGGMPVDHQKHLATPSLHEILQKRDKRLGVQLAGVGRRPELPARVDGADDVEALPLAGGHDLRRLSLQTIGAAQWRVGLKSRLIQKENLRPSRLALCLSRGYVSRSQNSTAAGSRS